jgi:soluble lytic murein transglycosylase-like protein
LPLSLFEAVTWQESGWYQGALSPTGAVGVGQIEPGTAQFISQVLIGHSMNAYSLSDNIEMSAAYLSYLSHVEGSNQCATLAAYYEGPLELQTYGLLPDARNYVSDVEALVVLFK